MRNFGNTEFLEDFVFIFYLSGIVQRVIPNKNQVLYCMKKLQSQIKWRSHWVIFDVFWTICFFIFIASFFVVKEIPLKHHPTNFTPTSQKGEIWRGHNSCYFLLENMLFRTIRCFILFVRYCLKGYQNKIRYRF